MNASSKTDIRHYDALLWDTPQSPAERLQSLAEPICARYAATRPYPCKAVFYAYTGLTSTIRIRKGITHIRISDILTEAPSAVLEALIRILIAQMNRSRPRPDDVHTYETYLHTPAVAERHRTIREQRSRKAVHQPQGRIYNLEDLFHRMNNRYFNNSLAMPNLCWSQRISRRRLGFHDEINNRIVLSRWLDRTAVPRFVVDYVMYHEMLHIVIPPVRRQRRRVVHPPDFRAREHQFEDYQRVLCWLEGVGLSSVDADSDTESRTMERLS